MAYTRPIYLGFFLAALAQPGLAQEDKTAYCERQALDITREIVRHVLPDLDSNQRARVQAAANQACIRLISKDPGLTDQAKGNASTDWFTNYILNGKPADKPGNKRLKDLK